MNEEKLDELWALVKHVGDVDRLDDGAMLTLGSVFGQMKSEILKLQKEVAGESLLGFDEEDLEIIRELLSHTACGYERVTFYYDCCNANEIIKSIDDVIGVPKVD